jgi:hypothetical protein
MAHPANTPGLRPWRDPIVAEVRAAREALYAEAGYDVHELCRRLQEKQQKASRVVVSQNPGSR